MLKKRSGCIVVFCLICVILLSPVLTAQETADIPKGEKALQEQAALYARSGDFEKAFTLINEVLKETNNAHGVVSDYIVILAWAGKCQEAINAYEELPVTYTPPNYVLPEVAKCYRIAGEYDKAIALYKQYLKLEVKD